jgi:hypothetical protein
LFSETYLKTEKKDSTGSGGLSAPF